MIGLGIPMAIRRVKPNRTYGARMKYTLMNDDIWYDVNAMAGKGIIIIGVLEMALGAASIPILKSVSEKNPVIFYLAAAAGIEILGLIIITVLSAGMSKRMAEEKGLIK